MKRNFHRNNDKLLYLLMRGICSRLLKLQHLIHLATEEEKQRAHLSWRMYDFSLYLVCFAPREELGEFVLEPEKVCAGATSCAISHSDSTPFEAKARPWYHIYAKHVVQRKK